MMLTWPYLQILKPNFRYFHNHYLATSSLKKISCCEKMGKFHSTKFTWVKIYHRLAPHAEGKACLISDIDIPSAK